jgi:hypothetical protein
LYTARFLALEGPEAENAGGDRRSTRQSPSVSRTFKKLKFFLKNKRKQLSISALPNDYLIREG